MKLIAFILLQFSVIQNQIIEKLNAFQESDGIRHGLLAASVHRISDNKTIINFNEDKVVNSASTFKLITTATAISKLGTNFKYITEVFYSGQIVSGVLVGDLILQSSGDPSFGSERGINTMDDVLTEIIKILKGLNISKIEGNVFVDDETVYQYDSPDSWIWGDMGNYYGALPHKFNVHENYYTVYFEPGNNIGDVARINRLQPFDEDWEIVNLVKTGTRNSGDQVYIYSSPASSTLILKGTVPLGKSNFPVKGSIPNPAKLFRLTLIKTLNNANIAVEDKPEPVGISISTSDLHLIKRFYSQPLQDLARDCNFSSINIYADAFLHTLALNDNGFETFNQGIESMKNHWLSKSLNLSGFNPKDGSGLSPSTYITPKNMTDILSSMTKEPFFANYENTIPVFGQDGSVRYKDPKQKTGGRVRAKSGSIEGTRAFAGYFIDKNGEKYSFMIAVNQYEPNFLEKVKVFLDDFLVDIGSF
jgi:D-alanyl-D-alanine carboxypeptidase/D-alanyl-D-alanine-endopeptidase (penicillin-binding protein 4)